MPLFLIIGVAAIPFTVSLRHAQAASLLSGFVETPVSGGLTNPTDMEFAPDGRLFVTQQAGAVVIIKNGTLLPTPFVSVPADTTVDRGLMGIAFDPDFANNHYLYLYYTDSTPTPHNRLSRFTADGDTAVPASEKVLLDFDPLSADSTMNIGGAVHFGADSKLYLATGDVQFPANSQSMDNLYGKILRLNADGTIPEDNPFYATAQGNSRAIWVLGLRNPFTFAIQPGGKHMFVNDVGKDTWEEIDELIPGANYGWPTYEGYSHNTAFQDPLYVYGHGSGPDVGCAITGGAFYNPPTNQFPEQFLGTYFFADFCGGWIKNFDPANGNTVTTFATGINYPVDLAVGPDGSLYYLDHGSGASGTGAVRKIQYTASQPPSFSVQPTDTLASTGFPATFTVTVAGTTPLKYQWQRNGADISGATSATYTTDAVTDADKGAKFRCVVSNAFGSATSNEVTLNVTSSKPPAGAIVNPPDGALYNAGDTITYSGTATDPQDGALSGNAFTWQVDLIENNQTQSYILPITGALTGTFSVPTVGKLPVNATYRISLTVTNSAGLTFKTTRELHAHVMTLTVQTVPAGLPVYLDDEMQSTPKSAQSVVNMVHKLEAPAVQRINGGIWVFDKWSDGGAVSHKINAPAANKTYTATYHQLGPLQEQNGQVVMEAENFDDMISRGSQAWILKGGLEGFVGDGYMRADPANNVSHMTPGYSALSPELRYQVQFTTPGAYYVWVRYNAPGNGGDAVHVGLDNAEVPGAALINDSSAPPNKWIWTRHTMNGKDATLTVATPGLHTINVWMAKDGMRLDRLLLTADANFTPDGDGPAESTRAAVEGTPPAALPTQIPTTVPTVAPTAAATIAPTSAPTIAATLAPTATLTLPPTAVPTSVPATAPAAAPTNAPTAAAASGSSVLKITYKPADGNVTDNTIRPSFKVNNISTTDRIEFSRIKVRYYFMRDTADQPLVVSCEYAFIGCGYIKTQFVKINPVAGADTYLEITFGAQANAIAPYGNSGPIVLRITKADNSPFDEKNDYSFDVTKKDYADWAHMTVYLDNTLVWGTEPPGQ